MTQVNGMKNIIMQVTYFLTPWLTFFNVILLHMMLCAIWYHLHNLKNVKNTNGGVLLLVKLQAPVNCTNATKSHNAPHTLRESDSLKEL